MNGVDHIGIAVSSLEETLRFYTEQLGLIHMKTEEVPTQKVKVAFVDAGNVKLELLEPLDSESPVAVFIEKRGQGIHHVAFKVNNIEERIQEMKERGIRMIDEVPRPGAGGADVAFMHPKAAHGVLFELCEKSKTEGE